MKQIIQKQKMMNRVLYALLPIIVFSIFLFGWRILGVIVISNIFAFVTEYLFIRQKKNGKVSMAVFVSATLLALTLPPTIPFWIAAVGSIIAMLFGKMVFGGFGMNIFNPAIVGRTFIYVSFPNAMTVNWLKPFTRFPGGFLFWQNTDLVTSATPLIQFKKTGVISSIWDLFFGTVSGSIGETSAVLIILAAIYLIITKTAKWEIMITTIVSVAVFSFIFYMQNPFPTMLAGGLLFGSVFMITDPITLPRDKSAMIIYGILVGFFTVFIRKFSLFTEGFMFALLLGNGFMPIIEYALKSIPKRKG